MALKSLVLIGHGMVGHRFVEALRARDDRGSGRSRPRRGGLPAYDRVGLSSYVGSWDRRRHSRSPATTTPATTS